MMRIRPLAEGSPGRLGSVVRVRRGHVQWVAERLSGRDWQIIDATNRLRLLSSNHIERLCFAALEGHSRAVVRGRVLRRLVHWQVLDVLPRRIGGPPRGSAGAVYTLGNTGARLLAEHQHAHGDPSRVRHPGAPTEHTQRHILAVSDLYMRIMEHAHTQRTLLIAFDAEPASWWPDGQGSYLKPDAYVALSLGSLRVHWWIEVDLATEHLPTIRRKLMAYLDFVERGALGPRSLVPRVLVATTTSQRAAALQTVARRLPAPAADLFVVTTLDASPAYLCASVRE